MTGKQKAQFNGHGWTVTSLCYSPNDTTLASGGGDKTIYISDLQTGQQKAKINGHKNCVIQVCFSPSATKLAMMPLSVYGKLIQVNKKQNQILTFIASIQYAYFLMVSVVNEDNIYSLDVKEISVLGKQYQDTPIQVKNHFQKIFYYLTKPPSNIFLGQFNYYGEELRSFFKSKGSLILNNQIEFKQQEN
ncbi:unnamed protein product (macronuclear) [Paramecium tetraurelia]|uniref:Uncharacterized protein n=1 Tax=Paramecium tetraurelia TaxID=5888 RepID=A0C1H0_PARTE|nr:uncharacterized protein GSPATT00034113001 [Paramecium tetraurelia]CAK64637.1 unnamed protein product [Paramecium tetraurelia]|eukprot:XP_001432034.1 hypothetical protein (macronuclear) [Paramecium tetraurelia strain d4-2]